VGLPRRLRRAAPRSAGGIFVWKLPNAKQAFDNVYSPENLEKIVRLEAAVDARVYKVLGRLVALKEFKRTPAGGATPALALPQPI
jgi:hypothetical protein